jgi:hypothetical protein
MKKAGIIIGVIIVLGLLFFWFEIRPVNIRSSCSSIAQQEAVTQYENSPMCHIPQPFGGILASCVDGKTYLTPDYNNYYNVCLEQYGLSTQ